MFGMQTDTDLKIILGVLVFLLAAMVVVLFWHFVRTKMRGRRPEGTMSVADLKNLESKNLLTKEEINALRHAMARQYLQTQETEKAAAEEAKGLKPLEALALEAQKVEIEAAKRAAGVGQSAAAAPAEAPLPRKPAAAPAPPPAAVAAPVAVPPAPGLPAHLQALVAKAPQEIEDMLNAGFLSQEDYDHVMLHRQRTACPRCIG